MNKIIKFMLHLFVGLAAVLLFGWGLLERARFFENLGQ